jgi:hypothetical protein
MNGLLALIGVLDVIDIHVAPKYPTFKTVWDRFYVLPPFTWRTWVVLLALVITGLSLRGAYKFALDYRKRFEDLTQHKLFFEIDERETRIELVEKPDKDLSVGIRARIKLRFENKDIHPMSMKRLDLTLMEMVANNPRRDCSTVVSFQYHGTGAGYPTEIKGDEFEGMMIQGRRLTPWYLIDSLMLVTDDEKIKKADDLSSGLYFLRLSMDAGEYQAGFKADLFLSWDAAAKPDGTTLTMTLNAPSVRRDYRRI